MKKYDIASIDIVGLGKIEALPSPSKKEPRKQEQEAPILKKMTEKEIEEMTAKELYDLASFSSGTSMTADEFIKSYSSPSRPAASGLPKEINEMLNGR